MNWPASKATRVLAALLRIGWSIKRQSGTSHRVLQRSGWPDTVFFSTTRKRSDRECSRESRSAPASLPRIFSYPRNGISSGCSSCRRSPAHAPPVPLPDAATRRPRRSPEWPTTAPRGARWRGRRVAARADARPSSAAARRGTRACRPDTAANAPRSCA